MLRLPLLVTLPVLLLAGTANGFPSDWPQWRGPARDGVGTETGLLKSWPEGGPALVWESKGLGGGYGAPAVHAGALYGAGYRGEDEVIWSIDVSTGTERWSTRIAAAYREMEYPEGPRATPAIDGGQLFTLGASGNLVCVDLETGKLTWSKDLHGELGGEMMSEWGYAESPLVDGDFVICTPGGPKGCVAALNRTTGEVVWRSAGLIDPASYSSLIRVEYGERAQYIVLTGQSVAGIAANNGEVLWRAARVGKTAVVPTPIFSDGHVWVTSGYGAGCNLFQLKNAEGKISAEMVYKKRTIKNGQGGALRIGDFVYAASGPLLICMEWRTGKTAWRERSLDRASLTYADGHLVVRGEQGQVALVEANSAEYKVKGTFEVQPSGTAKTWTHPVISGGRLYLRDQNKLSCYDIKAGE
jgi:outer membrane protein assembly factor BamB